MSLRTSFMLECIYYYCVTNTCLIYVAFVWVKFSRVETVRGSLILTERQ